MNVRRALALALVAMSLGLVPSARTTAAVANDATDGVQGSAGRIQECRERATKKNGGTKVDVLFVIDTSSSLKTTDPTPSGGDPARVRAMESVVSMLRTNGDGEQRSSTEVRVKFLDFGSKVRPSFGTEEWTQIDEFDEKRISEFGRKNSDVDTDYVGAFISKGGVVDSLTSARGSSDCQIVVLLTDGKFDFDRKSRVARSFDWLAATTGGDGIVSDQSSAERARSKGEELLCSKVNSRQTSLSDEIRGLDDAGSLTVIGVGLNAAGSRVDYSVLARLLEDKTCGTREPVGFVVEVASADELAGNMRKALYPNVPVETVCSEVGDGAGEAFVLAEPIQRADLFVRARGEVTSISLSRVGDSEKAEIRLFEQGAVVLDTHIPSIVAESRLLDDSPTTIESTLAFDAPAEQWVGKWVLKACTSSGEAADVDADLVVRGCIGFDLAEGDEVQIAGRGKGISLILRRCDVDATAFSTVGALDLSATILVDGEKYEGLNFDPNESVLRVPYEPSVASLSGAEKRNVKLEIVEVVASYEVLDGVAVPLEWITNSQSNAFDIVIKKPPKTPYVEFKGCGRMAKKAKSTSCNFVASAYADGSEVTLENLSITPSSALGDDVTLAVEPSEGFSRKVSPGESVSFRLEISLSGVRTNLTDISQRFDISFRYSTPDVPSETEKLTGYFVVEPDASGTPKWWRALALALGGLLLSLLIFAVARYIFAAIQVPREGMLWGAAVDVPNCDPESIRTAVASSRVEFNPLALNKKALGVREVSELAMIGDCNLTLRARAGWRLLSELGYCEGSHPGFPVIGSGGTGRRLAGRTSLNLVGEWWLVVQGSVDGMAENSDEVRLRLESLPGKLVFVAATAEPPQSFLSDVGFGVVNVLPSGLTAAAEKLWVKPRARETRGETPLESSTGPDVPEI